MNKYTVTVSYVCEANSEIEAIFALNKSLYNLEESEFNKFNPVDVKEVSQ